MKRWAVIVTLAYALLWLVLAFPVLWVLMDFKWWHLEAFIEAPSYGEIFGVPLFWGMMGAFVLAQATLLLVPVAASRERPESKRHILWPMLAVTFLLANLVYWGVGSLGVLALDFDTIYKPSDVMSGVLRDMMEQGPAVKWLGLPLHLDNNWYELAGILFPVVLLWMVWSLVFYRYFWREDVESWFRRWLRYLFRGSVLELLVMLPTHIAIRGKNDCCAPAFSFMGIVTGLAVMLMCFGPGVMFLYLDRARQLRPRKPDPERPVDGVPSQP